MVVKKQTGNKTMTTTRIEQLQKKRDQLNARLTTERAKLQKQIRKDETRRKVLVGAAVLKAVEAGEIKQEQLEAILNRYLARENDRKFMELF